MSEIDRKGNGQQALSWDELRRHTQARIGIGRAGHAMTTRAQLEFQLAHGQARDAVHQEWDVAELRTALEARGEASLVVENGILTREEYLKRPDLGRKLGPLASERLRSFAASRGASDVALVVSNGLSSEAIKRHATALLPALAERLRAEKLNLAPLVLVNNARVAVADEVGFLLGARLSIIAIGERPGLSASDSLALYLTHGPRPGNTDAARNCISNIRPPHGLGYAAAVEKAAYLAIEALKRGYSGVRLKDESVGDGLLDR